MSTFPETAATPTAPPSGSPLVVRSHTIPDPGALLSLLPRADPEELVSWVRHRGAGGGGGEDRRRTRGRPHHGRRARQGGARPRPQGPVRPADRRPVAARDLGRAVPAHLDVLGGRLGGRHSGAPRPPGPGPG